VGAFYRHPLVLITLHSTSRPNICQHALNIAKHPVIAKANDPIAILCELFCASFVTLELQIMHPAVDFYYQPARSAVEVGNEWAEWMLSAEFQSIQLLSPQATP